MKILIVEFRDPTHPEAGGAEELLFAVYRRIVEAGHEVDYLCCRHKGAAAGDTIDGIRVIRRGPQVLFNFVAPFVYRRELRERGYDVIVEGIDKLPFFMPLFERKVPVVCSIPHLFGTAVFAEANPIIGSYVWLWERFIPRVYRNCPVSALSESTRDDLVARGIDAEKIRVIHTGLDPEQYPAPSEPASSQHPTVLYIGRLKKYKGIDIAMRAVALLREKYPGIEYQVVGRGDYLDELRNLAGKLGIEKNVSFPGFVSHEEKIRRLQEADLLVFASPKEGWGLTVLEANACGTPAVASDSPGLREAVADGKTGFLVPHGDVQALSGRMDEILSDNQLRAELGAEAIRWAHSFSWERAAGDTLALLESAIAAGG